MRADAQTLIDRADRLVAAAQRLYEAADTLHPQRVAPAAPLPDPLPELDVDLDPDGAESRFQPNWAAGIALGLAFLGAEAIFIATLRALGFQVV